jgi:hypothetical protein
MSVTPDMGTVASAALLPITPLDQIFGEFERHFGKRYHPASLSKVLRPWGSRHRRPGRGVPTPIQKRKRPGKKGSRWR